MEVRICSCGAKPRVYEFGVQCSKCGLATRWYANQEAAINAWNLGADLIRRYPINSRRIKAGDEIYAK